MTEPGDKTRVRELPEHAQPYHRTPTFDEHSVPSKLTGKHSLKEGTWGLLQVDEGSIRFVDLATGDSDVIGAGGTRVITPKLEHHVEIVGPVRFFVEFYKES